MRYLNNHRITEALFNNINYIWRPHQGDKVLFWEDIWTREQPLAHIYRRLYRICRYKHTYIRDMLEIWRILDSSHDLRTRALYSREESEAREVYNILQEYNTSPGEDILIWKANNKKYITAEMYQCLNTTSNNTPYKCAFIWTL